MTTIHFYAGLGIKRTSRAGGMKTWLARMSTFVVTKLSYAKDIQIFFDRFQSEIQALRQAKPASVSV